MVEAGETFSDLALADPIAALHAVVEDESLRRLYRMADGRVQTALEIQRTCLERARRFHDGDDEAMNLIDEWDRVLAALQTDREALVGKVDWITKRRLMREVSAASRSTLEEADDIVPLAGDVLAAVGGDPSGPGLDDESRIRHVLSRGMRTPRFAALADRLEFHEWTWSRILELSHLSYQMRRLDLRWSELAPDATVYRKLRAPFRLTAEGEVEEAMDHPPSGTRACLRAALVREHGDRASRRVSMGWASFRGPTRTDDRRFPDPLGS
jgi:hypothetical protein